MANPFGRRCNGNMDETVWHEHARRTGRLQLTRDPHVAVVRWGARHKRHRFIDMAPRHVPPASVWHIFGVKGTVVVLGSTRKDGMVSVSFCKRVVWVHTWCLRVSETLPPREQPVQRRPAPNPDYLRLVGIGETPTRLPTGTLVLPTPTDPKEKKLFERALQRGKWWTFLQSVARRSRGVLLRSGGMVRLCSYTVPPTHTLVRIRGTDIVGKYIRSGVIQYAHNEVQVHPTCLAEI